jgi:hypothetical protein
MHFARTEQAGYGCSDRINAKSLRRCLLGRRPNKAGTWCLGGKNSDTRTLIYVDSKISRPPVTRIKISGDSDGSPIRTLAQLMGMGLETEEKAQEKEVKKS